MPSPQSMPSRHKIFHNDFNVPTDFEKYYLFSILKQRNYRLHTQTYNSFIICMYDCKISSRNTTPCRLPDCPWQLVDHLGKFNEHQNNSVNKLIVRKLVLIFSGKFSRRAYFENVQPWVKRSTVISKVMEQLMIAQL